MSLGQIGGLKMTAPLSADEERRLHPLILRGRVAAEALTSGAPVDEVQRRRLLRERHAGQEAELTLLRATCGLVRARVQERGYRFGNDELEAAGIEGLVNALRRFDPELGNRFSTYANYWIMKLVNQAVRQQAGLTDSEMRLVLRVQKLERAAPTGRVSRQDVAQSLGLPMARASEVLQMSRDLLSRRFDSADFNDVKDLKQRTDPQDAPPWVIESLRTLCGEDFDAFWQSTFRTMSIEDIAQAHGITRQGMTKRIQRCRLAVRESPQAEELQRWFDQQ